MVTFLLAKVIVLSFLQPLNAFLPMVLTFFPTEIFLTFLQFLNAFAPIAVTLYVTPLTLIVAATLTVAFLDLTAVTVAVPFLEVLTVTPLTVAFPLIAFGAFTGDGAAPAGAAAVTTNAAAKALTNTFFIAFIVIFPPFVFGIIYE